MENLRVRERISSNPLLAGLALWGVLNLHPAAFARAQYTNETPQQKAWEVLRSGISDKDFEHRVTAVRALGLIVNDQTAITMAQNALQDHSAEVRSAAATALGSMQAKDSLPYLRKALEDNDLSVAIAAAQSLISLGNQEGYDIYYAVLTAERKTGGGLLDQQLKMVRDPKKMAMFGFEQGIAFVPFGAISYNALKTIRKDDTSPVRAAAAKMLANDPDPRTAQALVRATADKSWIVRTAALDAIARRNDPTLIPQIALSMSDEKSAPRYTAAAAVIRLSQMAQPGGTQPTQTTTK